MYFFKKIVDNFEFLLDMKKENGNGNDPSGIGHAEKWVRVGRADDQWKNKKIIFENDQQKISGQCRYVIYY